MTQEFVTLPREVVEQALESLLNEGNFRKLMKPLIEESIKQIKAALEQPPTTEQSSAVEQQQGEQEPVALLADAIRSEPTELIHKWRVLELIQDHARKQPKRELMDNEARRIYNAATYHASLAVFMTRMDAENPDADDKGVSGWLQEAEDRVKRRITEAAHEIGQAAAPQQGEQEPVATPDECPHIIWFDDSDMRPMMFAGRGARDAALKAFERVSVQWNAHLFVRIQKNSRDDQYPCAPLYTNPQPKRGPLTDDQISRSME